MPDLTVLLSLCIALVAMYAGAMLERLRVRAERRRRAEVLILAMQQLDIFAGPGFAAGDDDEEQEERVH